VICLPGKVTTGLVQPSPVEIVILSNQATKHKQKQNMIAKKLGGHKFVCTNLEGHVPRFYHIWDLMYLILIVILLHDENARILCISFKM